MLTIPPINGIFLKAQSISDTGTSNKPFLNLSSIFNFEVINSFATTATINAFTIRTTAYTSAINTPIPASTPVNGNINAIIGISIVNARPIATASSP